MSKHLNKGIKTMRKLFVIAEATIAENLLKEIDLKVPGIYPFQISSNLSDAAAATKALDQFHSKIPVSVLDDFSFHVEDADGNAISESP